MKTISLNPSILVLISLSFGCDQDANIRLLTDGGADAAETLDGANNDADLVDGNTPDAAPPNCGSDFLPALPADAVVGMVHTDYTSTAISWLRADGTLTAANWLHSGTTAAGLVSTLSGDVAIARHGAPGVLTILDRFRTDVVTSICTTGELVGQLRATESNTFTPNPHDVAVITPSLAWMSRYESNRDAASVEAERGGDLIAFDPRRMIRLPLRVDLSDFGSNVSTAGGVVRVTPRPDALLPMGGSLIVSLERLQEDLTAAARASADGVILSLDASSGTRQSTLMLEGLRNCGELSAVPDADNRFFVLCKGWSDVSFSDEAGTRATAGIVLIERAADGTLREVLRHRFLNAEELLATQGILPLSSSRVLSVAAGNFGDRGDAVVVLDLDGRAQRNALQITESFALGRMIKVGTEIWVSAASGSNVRIHRLDAVDFAEADPIVLNTGVLSSGATLFLRP